LRLPLVAAAAQSLINAANDPVAFCICEVPSRCPPVLPATLAPVSCNALYAAGFQPVFRFATSVKLALVLPLVTAAAQSLFDPVDDPVTLLESQIYSHVALVFLAIVLARRAIAVFASNPQSVLLGKVSTKVTHALALPLQAFSASLLLDAFNRAMRFSKLVVSLRHSVGSSQAAAVLRAFVRWHGLIHLLAPGSFRFATAISSNLELLPAANATRPAFLDTLAAPVLLTVFEIVCNVLSFSPTNDLQSNREGSKRQTSIFQQSGILALTWSGHSCHNTSIDLAFMPLRISRFFLSLRTAGAFFKNMYSPQLTACSSTVYNPAR